MSKKRSRKVVEFCSLYRGLKSTVIDACGGSCPNVCVRGRKALRKFPDYLKY